MATLIPVDWSVALNRNIAWRTALPNGGQSGIAVWGDRPFLTTFDVYREGDPKFSGTILGHCVHWQAAVEHEVGALRQESDDVYVQRLDLAHSDHRRQGRLVFQCVRCQGRVGF